MNLNNYFAYKDYKSSRTYYDINSILGGSWCGGADLGGVDWENFDDGWKYDTPVSHYEESKRIELRYILDLDHGSDRGTQICTVWFDGQPAGLVRRSGRSYSDDYDNYFIDNLIVYNIEDYLRKRCEARSADEIDDCSCPADKEVDRLGHFAGYQFGTDEDGAIRQANEAEIAAARRASTILTARGFIKTVGKESDPVEKARKQSVVDKYMQDVNLTLKDLESEL
jgi:hypothetical protein